MLTPAQLQTLKADIAASEFSSYPNDANANFEIAAAYNLTASPDFIVWKTAIPTSAVKQAVVWTEYIARSQGERDAFVLMTADGSVNASDANIRQGFLDIFSGPGGATTRTNLTAISKRKATRAEKVFASGTGSDPAPASLTFEGSLSFQDVEEARRS